MSNSLKKSDPSDFWLDCLNQSPIPCPKTKSSKNIFFNPLMNYTKQAKHNKKIDKQDIKSLYQNSNIILGSLKSEEKPKKNNKKIKESLEYTNSLYERGMQFKQKKLKLIKEKNNNKKNQINILEKKDHSFFTITKGKYNNKKIQKKIYKNFHNTTIYERGMQFKQKKLELIKEKNNNKKNQINISEKKEHSLFTITKPKYKNKKLQKKILKNFGNITIYERGVKFQQKKMARIAELFEENNKRNNIVYPFHPDISLKNLNRVFFSDNFCKAQADNDSNKIFLSRLMKAREQEEIKKNYFENYKNKNIHKGNYKIKNILKKSLSQKDSIRFKKNLHETLLGLKCLEITENNNDINNENYYFNNDDFNN